MDCVSPALEDIPAEDWYCSGCKDVDITDLKYEPGDFDVEADNGKTYLLNSFILFFCLLQKL